MSHSYQIRDRQAASTISFPFSAEILATIFECIKEGKSHDEIVNSGIFPNTEVSSALSHLTAAGAIYPVNNNDSNNEVLLVTDSGADLPRELVERYNITVMPLTITIEGRKYRDGVDITPPLFYRQLKSAKTFPTTTPPSVEDFHRLFLDNIGTRDILGIFISRKMSKTFDMASQALRANYNVYLRQRRAISGDSRRFRIELIDSCQVSMGAALLVQEAAEKLAAGWVIERVKEHIDQMREQVQVYFMVDNLDYLARGGRIGRGAALLGSFFGFKPILGMAGGGVDAKSKAFGGRRAQKRLIAYMQEELDATRQDIKIGICHADALDKANTITTLIRQSFPTEQILVNDFGPTVGAHTGPGAVGVAWLASSAT